jgi:hypothetical protein
MKTKENNPYFQQVNDFFSLVKDVYMTDYRELLAPSQDSLKDKKKSLFSLQRQLADVEFQTQQKELAIKRQLDEELRDKKTGFERALEEEKHTKVE